jgi:putative tryptophan/tyrosine transport system permease protein
MIEHIAIFQGIIERGLIFSLAVAGVYIASRIINFDNLAIEGAFGLGGAFTAVAVFSGFNPWLALAGSLIIGALSGLATGLLNTKLRLNNLISGIVVTTGAFSIMLKLAGSNMPLNGKSTIFSIIPNASLEFLLILVPLIGALFITIKWFLTTEVGFLLKAVGDNPQMLINLGKSVHYYKILGLMLSNTLSALSGALFVQYLGYFSIWASVGVLIIGLAGLILAETVSKNFGLVLIVGSIAYQAIIAATFELQMDQDWNKLVTALLIGLLIIIKNSTNKE